MVGDHTGILGAEVFLRSGARDKCQAVLVGGVGKEEVAGCISGSPTVLSHPVLHSNPCGEPLECW